MMEPRAPLIETISARLGVRACPGEPLARHTSFRIGGPPERLGLPQDPEELAFRVRGEPIVLPREALRFRYRGAALPPRFVVTGVRFGLRREDATSVCRRMEEIRQRRVASQPHGRANAGSIFKNPGGDHAGRLIDVAGLKGARIGRARVSERHANFIVNEGGASADDVKGLMDLAQRVVWERSGVWLEPEVRFVGSW